MELDDKYFMQQALKQARLAFNDDEVPIGAVVVLNQQIIGRGYNQTRRLNDTTAHAEMLALTAAFQSFNSTILDECAMYVTVEPCAMCAGALKWARVGKIIYGTNEPKAGFTLYSPSLLHPKTQIISNVLNKECADLMQEFFKSKR
ncbi:MAG: nucleoside deaminase [Bacteroidetes bacterium]|nr:nucleoside deaminase [Bacteroidota bacterium]